MDILYMSLNISGRHALGVHGQDLLLDLLSDAGLVLFSNGARIPLSDREGRTPPHLRSWFAVSLCCDRCSCYRCAYSYSRICCSPIRLVPPTEHSP